jgi:hypothetical protein
MLALHPVAQREDGGKQREGRAVVGVAPRIGFDREVLGDRNAQGESRFSQNSRVCAHISSSGARKIVPSSVPRWVSGIASRLAQLVYTS